MAMYQTNSTVCVEFLRSGKGFGGRIIKLNYGPHALPPQLVGRLDMSTWGVFMQECAVLAEKHPYVIKPSGKQVGMWGVCFSIAAVIGFAAINPDGGSYPAWEAEVSAMLDRWRGSFGHSGLALSLQRTREHWIQIDIVGPPPMSPPPQQPQKEGYEHATKQGGQPDWQQQQGSQQGYQPPQLEYHQQAAPQGGQQWGQPQQQGFQPQTYQAQPHPQQGGTTY